MVKWTLAAEEAFGNLRRALFSKPVLTAPVFSKEFVTQADASQAEGQRVHGSKELVKKPRTLRKVL